MKPADNRIYLASKSPRRRELLRQINVSFELLLPREHSAREADVNEDVLANEAPLAYVDRVTREKAENAKNIMLLRKLPIRPILSADTTVVVDGQILGKPADRDDARRMLSLLSGRTHQVLTGVAVLTIDGMWQSTQSSDVSFSNIPGHLLDAYCATSEPYDKAGGYAVQGAAACFISGICGSYSGIMGLPLYETAQLLQQAGVRIL